MGGAIFFLCLYFVAPIFIAKIMLGASWHAVAVAYGLWFGALLLWGLGAGARVEEGMGWAIIMGMFLTIIALPVVVVGLKFAGVR